MLRMFHRRERGQVLMLAAALAPLLLGMTGMAVDVGGYAGHKRHLQNAADSITLAAANNLCTVTCDDTSAAASAGNTWAVKNNINPADVTLTFSGGSSAPTVRATIQTNHTFAFMRVLGISSKGIGSTAAAVRASFGGGAGIVPWSITQATVDASTSGALVTMKYDTTGSNIGNFGAIRIDGTGANIYGASAAYGSQAVACAAIALNCTAGACPGIYPTTCAENSPNCDGPLCDPENGNVIGPTRVAVDFRMNNTSGTCDTFGEAFADLGAGKFHLNGDCNPWTDGAGKCVDDNAGTLCSRRVIIIPVVDSFGNGNSAVTFRRFALVYLEGYDFGKCQGSSCDIKGRFVQADVNAHALAGAYDPQALIQFAKLID